MMGFTEFKFKKAGYIHAVYINSAVQILKTDRIYRIAQQKSGDTAHISIIKILKLM